MRRFLYFLPGVGGVSDQMIFSRGLADRFPAESAGKLSYVVMQLADGPAGGGCVVAHGQNVPTIDPSASWTEGQNFWVCTEDFPPGPADLEKSVGITGYDVQLGDDQGGWRAPLILRWNPKTLQHDPNVPTSMGIVKGAIQRQIVRRYQPAVDIAARTLEILLRSMSEQKDAVLPNAFVDAVSLLNLNYRIGVEEATLLGLLDDRAILSILTHAVDWPRVIAQGAQLASEGLHFSEPG